MTQTKGEFLEGNMGREINDIHIIGCQKRSVERITVIMKEVKKQGTRDFGSAKQEKVAPLSFLLRI